MEIREYGRYNEPEILRLYESVGWTAYTSYPEALRKGFENSMLTLAAYEGDKLISGDETDQYISGKMLAGEDEEYSLHIHKAVKKYIAIYYKGQQLIFNLSSAEATENCYNAIKSHMS